MIRNILPFLLVCCHHLKKLLSDFRVYQIHISQCIQTTIQKSTAGKLLFYEPF